MSTTTPQSVDELCDSLSDASARAHSVQIRGGGTRSRRGRPLEPDRVLSTDGLSGLIDYEPADMTVTVQAGTTVELLQHELESRRQAWPHADARPGSTVGGVLASGASGLARLRYGPVRDSLLQVVIVTGDGRRVSAGARTVKSVAGYDLPRLGQAQ
jgi:glycolate oxidase FAD binding subunit